MSIPTFLKTIFNSILALWGTLSEEQKKAIIAKIVNSFEATVRAFYRHYNANSSSHSKGAKK